MLPVVTGRFLFSQAPGLATADVETGQLQPGRLQPRAKMGTLSVAPQLCPEAPKWACHPRPQARLDGLSYPRPQASVFPIPSCFRQEEGVSSAVIQGQGRADGPRGQRQGDGGRELQGVRAHGFGLGPPSFPEWLGHP